MKLEYLIIFKDDGIPIYSRCFGSFCARVGFDDSLYSGFLSALTTMPSMFGDQGGLQSVEMGFTKLHFSTTTPSGHRICVGIDKDTIEDEDIDDQLEGFYRKINEILENKYAGIDWVQVSQADIEELENTLIHEAIFPSFPYFTDNEVCKDECPFDHEVIEIDPITNQPVGIVERFRVNYAKGISLFKRILGPLYLRLYRWFDLRKYRKKRDMVSQQKPKKGTI